MISLHPVPDVLFAALTGEYAKEDANRIIQVLESKNFQCRVISDGDGEKTVTFKLPRMAAKILGKQYEWLWDKVPGEFHPLEFAIAFVYGTKFTNPAPRRGGSKRGFDLGREFVKTNKAPEFLKEITND